jgi:hypothetical protein
MIDVNEDHQTFRATALGRRGFKATTADLGAEALLARDRRGLMRHPLVKLPSPHAAESLRRQLEELFGCPSEEASFETTLRVLGQNPVRAGSRRA